MKKWLPFLLGVLLAGGFRSLPLSAQDTLSQQVLRLLTRNSPWTGTQTFSDLRIANVAIPSITTYRIYADTSGNLYFNGGLIAGSGGGVTPHNFLSSTHTDTTAADATRGDIVTAQGASPKWARLARGTAKYVLTNDGTDTLWGTDGSALTSLNGANISAGTIVNAGISASAAIAYSKLTLTNSIVNADIGASAAIAYSKLSLGTSIVNTDIATSAAIAYSKLALTGSVVNADIGTSAAIAYSKLSLAGTIVNADVSTSAAIAYSKLALTGTIVNADHVAGTLTNTAISASAAIAYSKLALANSVVNADIGSAAAIAYSKLNLAGAVKLVSDVTGVLPFANGGTNLSTAADDTVLVSSGTAWVAKAVPNCTTTTSALGYTTATNAFSCIAVAVGTGTVTSAGLAMPAIFSVASSPITTSGTITVSLATEAANLVWAGPTSGSAAAPTFRALVSADIPLTLASGTITSSTPWNWTQTWNAAGVTFRGQESVFTETASAAASTYARWLGGAAGTTVEFAINKGGTVLANGNYTGTAGTSTLGTTALPFLSVILGTAATNNLTIQPAAFSQGTVATADDPKLTTTKLALIKRGTLAFATTAVTNGTCSTPVTATITGLLTTAAVYGSPNTALQTAWKTGVFPVFYATADTVNLTVCNPTAGSITPENQTFNYVVVVP